ncbi:hypothetical protein MSAN_02103700 [Mycena sanguinolenta]|uniref:Uncharacterized protein n=1 Tax=Mycena sanguinolenta TaxID=230812 RepID=A0A8H7CMI4_9AGAR|nr:hypothetical protein MSAN_02103700 [Mycena sanguinolenta]
MASYPNSRAALLLDGLASRPVSLMAESTYDMDFKPIQVQSRNTVIYSRVHQPSSTGTTPSYLERFRPIVFGEVKEIIFSEDSVSENFPCTVLSIGLPANAPHSVDCAFWNQLAELDYVVKREAADDDCVLPNVDIEYMAAHQVIPWSLGPQGDNDDRVFVRIGPSCTKLWRSLPSRLVFGNIRATLDLPATYTSLAHDFHAVVAAMCAPRTVPMSSSSVGDSVQHTSEQECITDEQTSSSTVENQTASSSTLRSYSSAGVGGA